MSGHEHQVSPFSLWQPHHGRENPRRERAGSGQQGPARGRPRRRRGLVDPDGRLWRAGAAVADDAQCLNGGLGWLEVECNRCKTQASLPLDAIRRPRDTPLWKLEASLKCRSCRKGRYAPPVHMIKLTETREITPYIWVHPDEER
jgi:hypothetical protein